MGRRSLGAKLVKQLIWLKNGFSRWLEAAQNGSKLKSGSKVGFGTFLSFLDPLLGHFQWTTKTHVWPTFGAKYLHDDFGPEGTPTHYRHIQNYYLSNSKTFQDGSGNGNGNGNKVKINSNDFQDGNWESMEMQGWLRTPRR